MALYGYKESPRLWSDYRDQELATMEFPCEGGILTLQQMITEPNMWRMMLKRQGPALETVAEDFVGSMWVIYWSLGILHRSLQSSKECKRNGRHQNLRSSTCRRR